MEQLISLILKVAKEQAYCFPGNKVMIFTVENEGKANETAAFRMIDIDEEWEQYKTLWPNMWATNGDDFINFHSARYKSLLLYHYTTLY